MQFHFCPYCQLFQHHLLTGPIFSPPIWNAYRCIKFPSTYGCF
jgi:hypothetical protein